MPIKKPERLQAAVEVPDVNFIDELVRRSLAVNPQLRGGLNTHEFLSKLRDEALATPNKGHGSAQANAPSKPAATANGDAATRTLDMFVHQRSGDFARESTQLRAEMERLEKRRKELCQRTADQLVDFLRVLWGEGGAPPQPAALKRHAGFLAELGVTDSDLLRQALRR